MIEGIAFNRLSIVGLLLFFCFASQAQEGIYFTYQDYLNNKLSLVDSGSFSILPQHDVLHYRVNGASYSIK